MSTAQTNAPAQRMECTRPSPRTSFVAPEGFIRSGVGMVHDYVLVSVYSYDNHRCTKTTVSNGQSHQRLCTPYHSVADDVIDQFSARGPYPVRAVCQTEPLPIPVSHTKASERTQKRTMVTWITTSERYLTEARVQASHPEPGIRRNLQ